MRYVLHNHQEENDDIFLSNCIVINNIDIRRKKERKRFAPLISRLRTFGKGFGIQVLEKDIWKRTVVGAHPRINGRKEVGIVSNEPSDVATARERIWFQLENVNEKVVDIRNEYVKDYTSVDIDVSDALDYLLQHFLKDALFKDDKFIGIQIDPRPCEISY